MSRYREREVLAPAGSPEALEAAVRCGADAVYLGAGAFNARRNAHNFSTAALREAVEYCHARNVRVHLTLNTLVRQEEMDAALAVAEEACGLGIDALIVQDMGLASRIRAAAPDMPLHASTQLSCHTPAGVRQLAACGFSRVVLAREMSLEEIRACAGQGCELEAFVHGALCMCVSGQCYLSAMLGGRSGNRGLCAQPCRLPFAPAEAGRAGDRTALSLKDLSLAGYMDALAEAGVCSFKIEGRMKRPEYVAAAVTVYAAAARGETPSPQAMEDLQAVFSRSGFTDGYLTGQRGSAMFGKRSREDVAAAAPVLGRLARLYDRERPLVPVDMRLTLKREEAVSLCIQDREGRSCMVTGDKPAIGNTLDSGRAAAQLSKTGGTPFFAEKVDCEIEEGAGIPVSALNALRRKGLEQLLAQRGELHPVSFRRAPVSDSPRRVKSDFPFLLARFSHAGQVPAAHGPDLAFVPLDTPPEVLRQLSDRLTLGVEIPRGLFGREKATVQWLSSAKAAGVNYALCGNVGAIPLAQEAGLKPVGGFGLNITNEAALEAYAALGLYAAVLSMELTFIQMRFAVNSALPVGIFAYGRQPLMLMRNCPRRAASGDRCRGCSGAEHPGGLIDRRQTVFPVMCNGGCAELLNAVPLYWADRLEELPPLDFRLLHFTDETQAEAAELISAYRRGGVEKAKITRGLYRRGVE